MEVDAPNEVESSPPPLREPPQIQRLDPAVVNRIAAGEVIQRPLSAVKELVENSLDAGATSVSVVVKDGGLKLIQVSDDGHGIRLEDMPILCERHTTSKLSKFEDLETIKSMGFRGEALASMTYVGDVTVTTITKGKLHGYRASYREGVMVHVPKACAAVKGTQILVENLFHNMPARRKTLQKSADDYFKIVDLLSRFSVHHTKVGFSCRKHGSASADVHNIPTASRLDAIKLVYGLHVAQNLVKIESCDDSSSRSLFKMGGYLSNSNYVAKKSTMILFINDRLVECTTLKRSIEVVYAATHPKASKPFIYMSIVLPPEDVDVNVHPTKREVSLLNQEIIISKIRNEVEALLITSNEGRTFRDQTPGTHLPTAGFNIDHIPCSSPPGFKAQKHPVHKMVRVDSLDPAGRFHAYLGQPSSKHEPNSVLNVVRSFIRQRRNPKESADITNLQHLVNDIDQDFHPGLLDIVRNCSYVGMADDVFALLQHDTYLYLANVVTLSKELMYQQILRRFAHFSSIQLSESARLSDLIMLALKDEKSEFNESDDLKEKIAEMNTTLLKKKAEMLQEFFCIQIDHFGRLSRLPVVLDQYLPDMDRLPEFILSLANDVDWEDEKNCIQQVAAAVADFYAIHPPLLPNPSGDGLEFYKRSSEESSDCMNLLQDPDGCREDEGGNRIYKELVSEAESMWAQREWSIQHVLFPAMRLFFNPPPSLAAPRSFVQVISLEKLYKVFERC